ncbi:UbiD family decarboxylase [Phlyctema vagabunda]|uniref:UbiD family decarboxylase n=1 Tax=Phlyctema vagabunda TaxID=108571 RepID=A0ABR4PJP0_9HELO
MRNKMLDDYTMILPIFTYTTAIAGIYTYDGLMSSIDFNTITTEQSMIIGRQLGILNVLSETAIQTTLWTIKASLLIVYYRLTFNLEYNKAVIAVGVFTGLGYVTVLMVLYYGWCRPFSQYLVLQPEVEECLTWRHYNIIQLALNTSSDLMILIVPVATVLDTRFIMERKTVLACIFSLGIFTITATILTKISVFNHPTEPVWVLWSIREVSTAMLVGNLILCRPMLRKINQCIPSFRALPSLSSRKPSQATDLTMRTSSTEGTQMSFITVPPIMLLGEKNSPV